MFRYQTKKAPYMVHVPAVIVTGLIMYMETVTVVAVVGGFLNKLQTKAIKTPKQASSYMSH